MRIRLMRQGRRFAVQVVFGKGAGYKGGRTLFLAWDSNPFRYARDFRAGRDVEDVIETAMDKLGAAPPPTPAPEAAPQRKSPEELAIEMENAKTKRIGVVGDLQARQVDQQLAFGDQQLKGIAMQRDPQPQAAA